MAKRILIVDDDIDYVDILTFTFQREGYEVLSAHDGETGFGLAVRENPDLIVLDVMMRTVTEGLRVARQLHTDEKTCGIPVLMVSAIKDMLKLEEDFEPDEIMLPIYKFMEKPVSSEELLKVVHELLGEGGKE